MQHHCTCFQCGSILSRNTYQMRKAPLLFCNRTCLGLWRQNTPANLWPLIDKTSSCWLFTGGLNKTGYGVFTFQGRQWIVHRLVWTLIKGPIPDGLNVLHDCPGGDNPQCCNPDHMFLGTNADNVQDCRWKGRARYPGVKVPKKGEETPNHKLTEAKVLKILATPEYRGVQTMLATRHGVSAVLIGLIRRHQAWKYLHRPILSDANQHFESLGENQILPVELTANQ